MHDRSSRIRGFTLVELLVVIAIISMLMLAILPAVQSTRSAARRAQCKSNMLQLVMASQNYEMAYEVFPAGVTDAGPGPIRNTAMGQHQSWILSLLPFMDEGSLHRNIDLDKSVYDDANSPIRKLSVAPVTCPTGVMDGDVPQSSYAACHHDVEAAIDADNSGVFFLNSRVTVDDVRDGLSHTIFFGEKKSEPDDLGWMSGTRATLRNTGWPINVDPWRVVVIVAAPQPAPLRRESDVDEEEGSEEDDQQGDDYVDGAADGDDDQRGAETSMESVELENRAVVSEAPTTPKTEWSVGGFGSHHGGGAHMSFGDGRIQFMSTATDPVILQQLGHRDDGKLLDPQDYLE